MKTTPSKKTSGSRQFGRKLNLPASWVQILPWFLPWILTHSMLKAEMQVNPATAPPMHHKPGA